MRKRIKKTLPLAGFVFRNNQDQSMELELFFTKHFHTQNNFGKSEMLMSMLSLVEQCLQKHQEEESNTAETDTQKLFDRVMGKSK